MPVTMSIRGLYNWDNGRFDGCIFPSNINRLSVIDTILETCGELETLYPEPKVMKIFITDWSHSRQAAWAHLAAIQDVEYNPIHNYDRTETWTDTDNETESASKNGTVTGTGTNTETHKQTAFNSNQLQTDTEVTDNNTASQTANSLDNTTRGKTGSHNGRLYGNIGVTTTQQMLQSELDFWDKFDIYQAIANDFKKRFCIMVY